MPGASSQIRNLKYSPAATKKDSLYHFIAPVDLELVKESINDIGGKCCFVKYVRSFCGR